MCFPHQEWFDFSVPQTLHEESLIYDSVQSYKQEVKPNSKMVWLGKEPFTQEIQKKKKGKMVDYLSLTFFNKTETYETSLPRKQAEWLLRVLNSQMTYQKLGADFNDSGLGEFKNFTGTQSWQLLRSKGLLFV